jgi:hypothetical protein
VASKAAVFTIGKHKEGRGAAVATRLMKLISKLGNPIALIAEGFIVGALVIAAINPQLLDSHPRLAPDSEALVRNLTS